MKTSIVKLILAVILLTVTAADASAQDAQLVDETSPRITRSQRLQIKRLNEGLNAKLKPRLQRDKSDLQGYSESQCFLVEDAPPGAPSPVSE